MIRKPHKNSITAPPRSLYRKLQIVISEAHRGEHNTVDELVRQIRKRGHKDFTTSEVLEDNSVRSRQCSEETVKSVIVIASEFDFINGNTGELTAKGTVAIDPNKYDSSLRKAVTNALEAMGSPMDKILKTISTLSGHLSTESLPTTDVLFDKLFKEPNSVKRKKFHTYLGLLSLSRGIQFSRKKIYLPG